MNATALFSDGDLTPTEQIVRACRRCDPAQSKSGGCVCGVATEKALVSTQKVRAPPIRGYQNDPSSQPFPTHRVPRLV